MLRSCEASVTVAAAPEAVWAVVADVTRVGEWSGECRGCDWVGETHAAVAGARFRGHNRRRGFGWRRLNEVVRAEPPRELVWRTLPTGPYPDSVEWTIHLAPEADATRVTESFTVLTLPRWMERGIDLFLPPHRDRTEDLTGDLSRLKAVVERGSGT
jgi:uncharacterized protein YndB with AHSA1/START domain